MNAKFLERMILYRDEHRLNCAKILLSQKIKYQYAIVGHKKESLIFIDEIKNVENISNLLLIEARAAKIYWHNFATKLGRKIVWQGRRARRKDVCNKLLDIGYHYLNQKIAKICQEIDLPTELGFFHTAQSAKAHPLVYDFMEWLRPIVIDDVLLKIVGKKKKEILQVNQKIISLFIYKIKQKCDSCFFHRKLGYCITLDYWVRLLLLEFMRCVNEKKNYKPVFPSLRNESRCKNCKKTKPPQSA